VFDGAQADIANSWLWVETTLNELCDLEADQIILDIRSSTPILPNGVMTPSTMSSTLYPAGS